MQKDTINKKSPQSVKTAKSPKKEPAGKSTATATKTELKLSSLNIRSYQVGFGDCFLLTFAYPDAAKIEDQKRHILIDFGSTGLPPNTPANQMMLVAQDIAEQCRDSRLHVVVATHRHKDHISGFTTQPDGRGTGDIIAGLKPEAVIQPWTEDPDAHDPAALPPLSKEKKTAPTTRSELKAMNSMHISSLSSMNEVSDAVLIETQHLSDRRNFKQPLGAKVAEQLRFLADDNGVPNKSAVENLRKMGQNYYVHHGSVLNLENILPGIKINVLGPPTLEQHAEIQKERASDPNEFWMLRAAAENFWGQQAATSEIVKSLTIDKKELFPNADIFRKTTPAHNRWFIRQIRAMRADQMLGLVRILDKAMNNTSVILLFEIAGKKLLFSGDAQIENWEYALSTKQDMDLLKDVDLYKVGHHGSRNATPRTLWNCFDHKSTREADTDRLKTVVSTMEGKHGSRTNHSEVPRQTLVEALSESSEFHTTQTAAKENKLFEDIPISFS